jgi:hypothetical protein
MRAFSFLVASASPLRQPALELLDALLLGCAPFETLGRGGAFQLLRLAPWTQRCLLRLTLLLREEPFAPGLLPA